MTDIPVPSWKRPLHARHVEHLKALREFMVEYAMTSRQMARALGYHQQTLRRYMAGYRPMPPRAWRTLKRMMEDAEFRAEMLAVAGPPVPYPGSLLGRIELARRGRLTG